MHPVLVELFTSTVSWNLIGGTWVDQEVATDRNWVSSRKPDDLPAFNRTFIELLAQQVHA